MAVRTEFPWWGRGAAMAVAVALIAGMWWWGFDFGQLFGVVNHREAEARIVTLESDNAMLRAETAALRARNSALESELAIARGARDALARQAAETSAENVQVKEESAYLQQLLSDANPRAGIALPRLAFERQSDDIWRYSLLVVRGGNPRDDFTGRLVLEAALKLPDAGPASTRLLTLPDDQPDLASPLRLAFRHYQRIEGTFRVPTGAQVTALTARAFDATGSSPRGSRTVGNALNRP